MDNLCACDPPTYYPKSKLNSDRVIKISILFSDDIRKIAKFAKNIF